MHPSEYSKRPPKRGKPPTTHRSINIFDAVKDAARARIRSLAEPRLIKARMSGDNLMVLNTTREDRRVGSFGIKIRTGAWADLATNDQGRDMISFFAYINGQMQIEAARELAAVLGVRT